MKHLDTIGLICPEPIMLLHKAVRELSVNDVIEVLASDPSTQRDIPKFCMFLNHVLLLADEIDGNYRFRIKIQG